MKKSLQLFFLGLACCLSANAQSIKFHGVYADNRYDDHADHFYTEYIGSLVDEDGKYVLDEKGNVKTVSIFEEGLWTMTWDGTSISTPEKDPAVNKADFMEGRKITDMKKASWANNFGLMVANSGACYVDGYLVTVQSRDYQSNEDDVLFAVRRWNAKTGDLLSASDDYFPVSANIESKGMAYNPIDGKIYGLFHITDAKLLDEIINDPEYFTDEDDADWDREGLDDGYCLGTIDLNTMKITPITPGLYYENYVAFAINSEGRAFALTSGGTSGYTGDDGKIYNADNKLTGAQLIEFNLKTGRMVRNAETIYEGTDSAEVVYTYPYPATGYCSKAKIQSACFSKNNPNKMYWVGYVNSGKGINSWGSWGELPDREWKTNGKYDTALYEIDLLTGNCTRLGLIPNRYRFACMWIDGEDNSDGTGLYETLGINNVNTQAQACGKQVYNLQGVKVNANARGLQIVKEGDKVTKMVR